MSLTSLLELSIESINTYKKMIDNHKSSKEYGNDIVSAYNVIGENIEALTEEIETIFGDDEGYNSLFEDDEVQDFISLWLNKTFDEYEILKDQKKCEEKVTLAYEWLFEVMLFTTDDEDIKSKITLNLNSITLTQNKNPIETEINEGDKVLINVSSDGMNDDLYIVVEEVIDDYIYAYLGDKENEEDLIIFPKKMILKVR